MEVEQKTKPSHVFREQWHRKVVRTRPDSEESRRNTSAITKILLSVEKG